MLSIHESGHFFCFLKLFQASAKCRQHAMLTTSRGEIPIGSKGAIAFLNFQDFHKLSTERKILKIMQGLQSNVGAFFKLLTREKELLTENLHLLVLGCTS